MALSMLQAAGILEEDSDGKVMWIWSYPTFSRAQKNLIARKYNFLDKERPSVACCHLCKSWFYLFATETTESSQLNGVPKFGVVIAAADFNPAKYDVLLKMFAKLYDSTGSPLPILEHYLQVCTRGQCKNNSNGLFAISDYSPTKAYLEGSLKDVVMHLGIESILIYTSILLKKKLLVYHSNRQKLFQYVRAFPAFVWHRRDWSILLPWIHDDAQDLDELSSHPFYIAGTCDQNLQAREDVCDVYVDLTSPKITVMPKAKDDLSLGKIHKEIAKQMVRLADDVSVDNREFVEQLEAETLNVLTKLKALGGDDEPLTLDSLKTKNLNKTNERFLTNLAFAENLIRA